VQRLPQIRFRVRATSEHPPLPSEETIQLVEPPGSAEVTGEVPAQAGQGPRPGA
jgi:hypothetical protein